MEYDLFISHASEDKSEIVRPLAERLQNRGLRVWLDEQELTLGDSLRRSIDQGLSRSRYGLVILSPAFFHKEWPNKELDGLVAREDGREKVILPIWHNVGAADIIEYSPALADKLAVSTSLGLAHVTDRIIEAVRRTGGESVQADVRKAESDKDGSSRSSLVLRDNLAFLRDLRLALTAVEGKKIYVAPAIPRRVLANAVTACDLKPTNDVICVFDYGGKIFFWQAGGTTAVVFSDAGLHFGVKLKFHEFIPYEEISSIAISMRKENWSGNRIDLTWHYLKINSREFSVDSDWAGPLKRAVDLAAGVVGKYS